MDLWHTPAFPARYRKWIVSLSHTQALRIQQERTDHQGKVRKNCCAPAPALPVCLFLLPFICPFVPHCICSGAYCVQVWGQGLGLGGEQTGWAAALTELVVFVDGDGGTDRCVL